MAHSPRDLPIRYSRAYALWGAASTITVGCLVVVGWWLGIKAFTTIVPGLASMKPLTAICFVLTGCGLLLINLSGRVDARTAVLKVPANVCALITAATGAVIMAEILFGVNAGIDNLFFRGALSADAVALQGRMSLATATGFLCLGSGLCLENIEGKTLWRLRLLGQVLTLVAVLIGFMALLGYVNGPRSLYVVSAYSSMALHTACLLVIAGVASLLSFPQEALMAPVFSERLGGAMARWLLPAVLLVPLLLGFLFSRGHAAGFYGSDSGALLLAAFRAIFLAAIVWGGALRLNQLDFKRQQREERDLRLAAIVDSSDDAIISTTLDGIITSWNGGAEQIYGYSETEALGKSIAFLAPEGRSQEAPSFLKKIDEGQAILHYETMRRRKDGCLLHVSLTISPVRDRTGAIVGCSSVARDITEQKKNAFALREQASVLDLARTQLVAALEAGRMGTWIWDIAGDRLQWDLLSSRLLGSGPEDPNPDSMVALLKIIHPEDHDRVREAMAGAVKGGSVCDVEYRVVRHDKSAIWLESRWSLERDESGNPLRLSGVLVDINTRKQMEEYLLQSQKLQSLGTLAGGIAHDFNNILMAIGGNAQLAMQQVAPDDPIQRSLATIAKASARATFLVREIMAFSRQEESQRKVVNVGTTVEDALTLLRSTLPSRIEIRSHCHDKDARIFADPAQIQQVIMNLGANAAQAIDANRGLVEVSIQSVNVDEELARTSPRLKPGPYVRIAFSDNGCGMDPAVIPRIFDPFFTTGSPQRPGLGLSVVHGIMKNHDGAISVYSEPGKGSVFQLYLPVSQQAAQPPSAPMPVPAGSGERVLYVDDEEALVALVTRSLKRLGYEVSGFTDGQAALQAFQDRPGDFDVVISDVSMPSMSGWELCQKLVELRCKLPIVLTSGYVRKEDQEMAAKLGVLEVVLKPDTVDDLARALNRALEQKRKLAGSSLSELRSESTQGVAGSAVKSLRGV